MTNYTTQKMIESITYPRPNISESMLVHDTPGYGEPWWRHQMETFSTLLAFARGIHRSPLNSPHKGQWHGALMVFFICVWINGWVNNREAGDLRRHRAHYDVIVMQTQFTCITSQDICASFALSYCREALIVARLSKSLATLTLGSSKINQHCWRFHGSGVIVAPQL